MAEWTPNSRASYDADVTTERPPGSPPTATGWPSRLGSISRSTDTKKVFMSTWAMTVGSWGRSAVIG